MTEIETMPVFGDVVCYAIGFCSMSACVKKGLNKAEIERQANTYHPTGISSRWEITSDDFADGTPNPCPCDTHSEREHYLLHC